MPRKKIAASVRKSLKNTKKKKKTTPKQSQFLSTGCTLLNLAISDRPDGGFMKGKYFFLVGDSTSGKTFFSMTCFAEAVKNKAFDKYRFIYDNVEDGMLMDVDRLFGSKVVPRLSAPAVGADGEDVHSSTIEEFYYHLDDVIAKKQPFIYVLDSMDGLSSEAESNKFQDQKKAHRKGKDTPGSYGDGKAKKNSAGIRQAMAGIRETDSILIIICQTRDKLDAMSFGPKKTRSGGHSLKFYATVEIWTSLSGAIKKSVRGKNRKIGNKVRLQIKKNRITGKIHDVETAIYPSYGIDDVGSCIDYLLGEKWWTKFVDGINTKEFAGKITKQKLIALCEKKPKKLRKEMLKCWKSVADACVLKRKPRYD